MRWTASVPGEGDIRTVVIAETPSGAFLYLYDARRQTSSAGEEWYETAAAAKDACRRRYDIPPDAWSPLE